MFMEAGRTKKRTPSSVEGDVNKEGRKIKSNTRSPAHSAYADWKKWTARKVHQENDYFTLFEVAPVFEKTEDTCTCACARMPR